MASLDRTLLVVAGVLSGLTASTAAWSDEPYRVPDALMRQPELPEAMKNGSPPLALSMSEAIQLAVRQNLGIVLSREQYVAARRQIDAQWGKYFEPVVRGSYSASDATAPPTLSLLQNGDTALSLNTTTPWRRSAEKPAKLR